MRTHTPTSPAPAPGPALPLPRVQRGLTLLAVEDRQEAEHEGPAGGGEEAPPVIPDGEVGRHDLDAEQHAWGPSRAQAEPLARPSAPPPPRLLSWGLQASPPLLFGPELKWGCGGGQGSLPRNQGRVPPSQTSGVRTSVRT